MTPEEQKIQDELLASVKSLVTENTKGLIADKDLEAKVQPMIQKLMTGMVTEEKLKSVQDALDAMGLKLKATEEQARSNSKPMTFEQKLRAAFHTKKGDLESLARKDLKQVVIKIAADMTEAGNTSGSVIVPQWEPGLVWPGTQVPTFAARSNVRPATSALIWYAQKTNRDGTNAAQTQGSAKPQRDFDVAGATSTAWVASGWSSVTRQMLADVQEIQNEIQGEIAWQVNDFIDKVIHGGQTPTGITDVVNAFTLTASDVAVISPGVADAIGACIAQIQSNNFNPTTVFLNPLDYWSMALEKSDDGMPIFPRFTAMSTVWGGIEIVSTNQVTKGKIIVGDMTKSQVRILDSFNIIIGYNGEDLTENKITILGEMRLHNWVASNHYGAFVYDDISDIISKIPKA